MNFFLSLSYFSTLFSLFHFIIYCRPFLTSVSLFNNQSYFEAKTPSVQGLGSVFKFVVYTNGRSNQIAFNSTGSAETTSFPIYFAAVNQHGPGISTATYRKFIYLLNFFFDFDFWFIYLFFLFFCSFFIFSISLYLFLFFCLFSDKYKIASNIFFETMYNYNYFFVPSGNWSWDGNQISLNVCFRFLLFLFFNL